MKKTVPIIFVIVSLVYFIYVLNSGSTVMIGDDLKGDPGSILLPIFVSVIMFICSVYLLFKREPDVSTGYKENVAFYLTLILSIIYVLFFRFIGFLLITNFLIFTLVFFYSTKTNRSSIKFYSLGLAISSLFSFVLYTISRFVARFLIITSRKIDSSWMRSSVFIFFSNLAVLLLLLFFAYKLFRKAIKGNDKNETGGFVFLSVCSAVLLFLVFKQLFNVNLVQGLIWF